MMRPRASNRCSGRCLGHHAVAWGSPKGVLSAAAQARRRSRLSAAVPAAGLHDQDPGAGEDMSSVIASVLNEQRGAKQQTDGLLASLDRMGVGIQTTVTRRWEASAVEVQMVGTWAQRNEARRMAMLAVFQEHLVSRAVVIKTLFDRLVARQPGLLEPHDVRQVAKTAETNSVNPAVLVLGVPQLTQLAAALFPIEVLEQAITTAVEQAQAALTSKPPYNYSRERRDQMLLQLAWVRQALTRGAAYARVRALLCPEDAPAAAVADGDEPSGAQQQQQQKEKAARWQQLCSAARQKQGGNTPEQVYVEQQKASGLNGGLGRVMQVSFHSSKHPSQQQPSLAAAAAAAGEEPPDVSSFLPCTTPGTLNQELGASELLHLCQYIGVLTQQVKILQGSQPQAAVGVLPEVSRHHRAFLLDLLVAWGSASPLVGPPQLPPSTLARVAVRSPEHDQLWRRICLEVAAGPELEVMRQVVQKKHSGFLAYFSPTVGNPFAGVDEWNYFRECPSVWMRFVSMPHIERITMTLRGEAAVPVPDAQPALDQQQQQPVVGLPSQQQQQQQLNLDASELNQLMLQLCAVLGRAAGPAAGGEAARFQIVRRPTADAALGTSSDGAASRSSSSTQVALQLLEGGQPTMALTQPQVASLVQVLDDIATQMPETFSLSTGDIKVIPASGAARTASAAASLLAAAAKALGATALLGLPLLAVAWPSKQLQHWDGAAAARSTPHITVIHQQQQPGGQQAEAKETTAEPGEPVNAFLSVTELQGLCKTVQEQLEGRVWLPASTFSERAVEQVLQSTLTDSPVASSSSSSSGKSTCLVYQVVVDRKGLALGVKPCNALSAAHFAELPLTAALRGPALKAAQERHYNAVSTDPKSKKALARATESVGYAPAKFRPLPADGVVVLKLVLQLQAAAVTAGATEGGSAEQKLQETGDSVIEDAAAAAAAAATAAPGSGRVVAGSGKAAMELVLLRPLVAPWQDADSLEAWHAQGATMMQDQSQAGLTINLG